MAKRRLGRGLDALLGNVPAAASAQETQDSADVSSAMGHAGAPDTAMRNIDIDLLQPGKYQPRTNMHKESLEDLASSIKAQGIVQPIVVRPVGDNRYEIIAGERRWRAAQLAGLQDVPAVVRNVPDEAAIAMALIENIQRENLNPIEEAVALQRLSDEFQLTHQEVADAVGRSRASVTNLLRLLGLDPGVKELLEQGQLEMGHARALLTLEWKEQSRAARQIVEHGLSVREAEKLVKKIQSGTESSGAKTPPPRQDPNIRRMQDDLSEKLGAKVTLNHGAKGKGKLIIHYNNVDELDGIINHIH